MNPINTEGPFAGYWETRTGGRKENQDSCGFKDTPHGLMAVVCDGMGGGPAGRLAADTAIQQIYDYICQAPADMPRTDIMREAIEQGHRAILAIGSKNRQLQGMGTTVAAILINDQSAIVAHVGDSRVYQFRMGMKIFRTADHSMVGELVRNGTLTEEQARLSAQANIITKALGGNLTNLADVTERPYEAGDRFMLCSDGIWGMLPEKQLISRTARGRLNSAVGDTIRYIDEQLGPKDGNTHDNMTIAVLETKKNSKLKEKMSKKTLITIAALAAVCLISIVANCVLYSKLTQPTPAQQQTAALEQTIKEKEQQLDAKQEEINKLREQVADTKDKAADAKMKMAEEKEKAAEKAKAEADKKAQEAAKEQQARKDAQSANAEIVKKVQEIIAILERAKTAQEGPQRRSMRADAVKKLETLCTTDSKHKDSYKFAIDELKKPIAAANGGKGAGQYASIINKLKTIK